MLIHNKDDIEFVTEFPCFLGHPVYVWRDSGRCYSFILCRSPCNPPVHTGFSGNQHKIIFLGYYLNSFKNCINVKSGTYISSKYPLEIHYASWFSFYIIVLTFILLFIHCRCPLLYIRLINFCLNNKADELKLHTVDK